MAKRAAGIAFALALAAALGDLQAGATSIPPVGVVRVPNGGIQPQIATGADGTVHVVYFDGDASHGNLFYVRSTDGGETFFAPLRINSQEGSAIAAGNIRGARIALGRNGRVHVSWNGSGIAFPRTADGKAPMLYSRIDPSGSSFESQRTLIHTASGIDGGGAIAADKAGNVYVFWHAPLPGRQDEADRRVWLAHSSDDGKTFSPERVAFDQPTGVCGCCGMNAFADSRGTLFALFRSAFEIVNRDMYLLTSLDQGKTFRGKNVSKWNVGYCVMSSEAFAESDSAVLAAWETEKQIFYSQFDHASGEFGAPSAAPGSGPNRKYPTLAINRNGYALLGWAEGMGWKKGGSAAWQLLDRSSKPVGDIGRREGVPVWGLVAAFAAPDGSFRIMY